MKKSLIFGLCAVALAGAASLLTPPVAAQSKATVTNVAVIPHEPVLNFFKNPPGIYTGENMGISTDSKGNIYIYHRAYETRLFQYNPQGVFVQWIQLYETNLDLVASIMKALGRNFSDYALYAANDNSRLPL